MMQPAIYSHHRKLSANTDITSAGNKIINFCNVTDVLNRIGHITTKCHSCSPYYNYDRVISIYTYKFISIATT